MYGRKRTSIKVFQVTDLMMLVEKHLTSLSVLVGKNKVYFSLKHIFKTVIR